MVMANQKGQTLVEYILLLAVIISLVLTVYRSNTFKKIFGEQGEIGIKMKVQNEFSFRHAFFKTGTGSPVQDIPRDNKDISIHPSYAEPGVGTRFFGPKEPYGN